MKVLAITASAKRNGNISSICRKLVEGAVSAGHTAEAVNLYDYKIGHCTGCLECTKTRKCVQTDDFERVYNMEMEADIIIFGAPIYCHSVPGILKDFIDRNCHAVIPYVNVEPSQSIFEKLKISRKYLNDFKINAPFKKKKFITVLACSNPSKNGGDMKGADSLLKKFISGEMGGKIIKSIKCPDTLFRLNPKAIERIYQEAFETGACIK